MTKKVISILLVICMLASPVSLVNVANAEEKSQNKEAEYSKELASHCEIAQLEKFIKYIYQCKDMGETFARNLYQNSDLKMNDDVFEYLKDKINIQQEATKKNLTQKEKYKVTVFLQNVEQCEDYVIGCDFQVISKYHYVGISEPTTVSELVQIKYDKLSHEILEFYTPMNYYDEEVKETNTLQSNLEKSLTDYFKDFYSALSQDSTKKFSKEEFSTINGYIMGKYLVFLRESYKKPNGICDVRVDKVTVKDVIKSIAKTHRLACGM